MAASQAPIAAALGHSGPVRRRRTWCPRAATLVLAAVVVSGWPASPVHAQRPARPLVLRYDRPATAWIEALPVGNGRLGAMVFGGVTEERIQFNEATLWNGAPHAYDHPGASAVLPQIRSLLFAGNQRSADSLASAAFMSVPLQQKAYQAFGDVHLRFLGLDTAVSGYDRDLDLAHAVATTRFRVGGTTYTRRVFASHPAGALVVQLGAGLWAVPSGMRRGCSCARRVAGSR